MFKKLVLMLSLVACTGLNAAKEDEGQVKVGFGTKVKNALWTNRTKTQLGLAAVAAFLAYVGARICVANDRLGFRTAVDYVSGFAPACLSGAKMEAAAKGFVGYNNTIPFLTVAVDKNCPYVHISKTV